MKDASLPDRTIGDQKEGWLLHAVFFISGGRGGPRKTFCLVLIFLFTVVATLEAFEKDHPFTAGEKLIFELKWEFVPAGQAVLEVLPTDTVSGEKAHHFAMSVKTNAFVDVFYKVRQRVDGYTDLSVSRSLFYRDVHTYGKDVRDITVFFDWKESKAQYANFGKKKKPVSLSAGTFDLLSIFYYARTLSFHEGAVFERPVTDGKKCVLGSARVIKKERIELEIGAFDTYLIEPDLKDLGGVFKKSKNAKIQLWVTADSRKIPVRIKSEVTVGSFIGDLVSIEQSPKSTPINQNR